MGFLDLFGHVKKDLTRRAPLEIFDGSENKSYRSSQKPSGEPDPAAYRSSKGKRSRREYNFRKGEQLSKGQTKTAIRSPRATDTEAKTHPLAFGDGPSDSGPVIQNTSTIDIVTQDTTDRKLSLSNEGEENNTFTQNVPGTGQDRLNLICAECELDPKVNRFLESPDEFKVPGCYICSSAAETKQLSDKVKTQQRDINALNRTLNDEKDRIESLEKALSKKQDETKRLNDKIQAQMHEIQLSCTKYEIVKAEFQKNEIEIRKLQQTEMAMKKPGDILMDEKAKALILDILRTKIQAIGKLYFGRISWEKLLKVNSDTGLINILDVSFIPSWPPKYWQCIRIHPKMSTQVMVKALLSSTISNLFFEEPFFQCGTAKDLLRGIYNPAAEKDPESAVRWRASTLSLFSATFGENYWTTIQSDIINGIFNSLTKLIQTDHSLNNEEMADLYKKLDDLIQSSAGLATDWHSRELYFRVVNIQWLHWRFKVYSGKVAKYVTPFPPTKKVEDGKQYEMLAVVSPGFIRYVKRDGNMEPQEVIWEKASVLLSEKPL